uniref:Sulfotransferase domain-containing protein n=1 Tax=Heterosigma akashiwo TaxID=2829 RepID=A0A7S4D468_HETAK
MEIQKTGSTKLKELFSGAINKCSSNVYWLSSASEGFSFYTSDIKTVRAHGVLPSDNTKLSYQMKPQFRCGAHHSDFEHLDTCLSSTAANVVYLTLLRNPVERVVSEFVHLKGGHPFRESGAWTTFQPSACNQTSFEQLHIPLNGDLQTKYKDLRSAINKEHTIEWRNHSALFTDFLEGGPASILLNAWVQLGESNPANNRMARHLAGPYTCEEDMSNSLLFQKAWLIKSAIHNLKTRFIYGLQDDLAFSIPKMNCEVQCLLNKIRPHDHYIRNCFSMDVSQIMTASGNTGEFNPDQGGHYKISATTQALILRHNHIDKTLFEFATEKNSVLRWCTEMC